MSGYTQVKWDGDAHDSLFSNPLNWENNNLPEPEDQVIFDNSILTGNYTVIMDLPYPVQLRSINIAPSLSDTIVVEIPAGNRVSPALSLTGPAYGFVIQIGGIFLNASGASSGASLVVRDSIYIANGGRYIHRTSRAHAALVDLLSQLPGTEKGTFEFDIRTASSTISLSGRKYGKLVLSAGAAGGLVNYTASGTMPILIRSDLEINSGVRLNLNCSDTLFVHGSLLQKGGVLNLSSLARTLVFKLKGSLEQSPGSVITETGSAFPSLLLAGDSGQYVQVGGSIENSVIFSVNNAAGIRLGAPLILPHKLLLIAGIVQNEENLITLLKDCLLEVDSSSGKSFVTGPFRKEGLENSAGFLFPVGNDQIRWLSLKNVTGNYTVQFYKENPSRFGVQLNGISRISSLDYWKILADGLGLAAHVELSFFDGNSSGVTDMGTLRVAILEGESWVNAGSSSTSGSAGSQGSVVSNPLSALTPFEPVLFALASSTALQNPLPLKFFHLGFVIRNSRTELDWEIGNSTEGEFIIEEWMNGQWIRLKTNIPMLRNQNRYTALLENRNQIIRIIAWPRSGSKIYSEQLYIPGSGTRLDELLITSVYSTGSGQVRANVFSEKIQQAEILLFDLSGKMVYRQAIGLIKGNNMLAINLRSLGAGIYPFQIRTQNGIRTIKTFYNPGF